MTACSLFTVTFQEASHDSSPPLPISESSQSFLRAAQAQTDGSQNETNVDDAVGDDKENEISTSGCGKDETEHCMENASFSKAPETDAAFAKPVSETFENNASSLIVSEKQEDEAEEMSSNNKEDGNTASPTQPDDALPTQPDAALPAQSDTSSVTPEENKEKVEKMLTECDVIETDDFIAPQTMKEASSVLLANCNYVFWDR